jgi:hypothetical protein
LFRAVRIEGLHVEKQGADAVHLRQDHVVNRLLFLSRWSCYGILPLGH